jgi:hypothetical protein
MRFKKIQTMALMILVVGLLVLVGASNLCAEGPYTGSIAITPGDPGVIFITGQNDTIHFRDAMYYGVATGGLIGDFIFVLSGDVKELFSGDGAVHGSFQFDGEIESLTGTFTGHLAGKVTDGELSARFIGSQGSQDFAGMLIKGTLEGPISGPLLYIAEIQ